MLKKIRINPQSSLHYSFVVPKKAILSKSNQVPYSFSQIFEMRIAFFSSAFNVTYDHFRKKTNVKV